MASMNEIASKPKRLLALDIFRGMTIFFMIVVNTPGSWSYVYPPLLHAQWDGLTPTDLVFPFFVFIVGVAMAYSFRKYEKEDAGVWRRKVIWRTVLIFLVGIFLNWFPFYTQSLSDLRIFGVLQRIALAYGVAAFVIMSCPRVGLPFVFAGLLGGYYCLLIGFGGEAPLSLEDNAVRKLDLMLVGKSHVYQGYGVPFDPEGLLSTLPTVCTVLFGYWIGLLIRSRENVVSKMTSLISFALVGIAVGVAWNFAGCPINKPIWSSSYVLITGGLATLTLILLLFVLDYKMWRRWSWPFEAFGMNPLAAYVASSVFVKLFAEIKIGEQGLYGWAYTNIFQVGFGNYLGSCLQAVAFAMLIWFLAWLLYRKRIVIKL